MTIYAVVECVDHTPDALFSTKEAAIKHLKSLQWDWPKGQYNGWIDVYKVDSTETEVETIEPEDIEGFDEVV